MLLHVRCVRKLHDRKILQRPSTSAKAVLVIVGPKQIVEEMLKVAIALWSSSSICAECLGAHLEWTVPVPQASSAGLLQVLAWMPNIKNSES
jgi:hypothetical protein